MNRILVWEHECDANRRVRLSDRRAAHIRDILRPDPGDVLRAGFVNGPAAAARVLRVDADAVELELGDAPGDALPPPPTVDLLLAMPRPKFLKRILPQLATLGVRTLYLCSAKRVESCYFATHLLRPENYLPLLLEGLEQGLDTRLPDLRIVRPLPYFLRDELAPRYAPGRKFLAHPGPRTPAAALPPADEPILLAIGSESGWTDDEVYMFRERGFDLFSLGGRVLRVDTACIALLSLFDYLRPPAPR